MAKAKGRAPGESKPMERLRGSLAVLLCLSLSLPSAVSQVAPTAASQSTTHATSRQPYQSSQLRGDDRILHALNRFTFGLRPGDLESVRAMGLDQWFAQ